MHGRSNILQWEIKNKMFETAWFQTLKLYCSIEERFNLIFCLWKTSLFILALFVVTKDPKWQFATDYSHANPSLWTNHNLETDHEAVQSLIFGKFLLERGPSIWPPTAGKLYCSNTYEVCASASEGHKKLIDISKIDLTRTNIDF